MQQHRERYNPYAYGLPSGAADPYAAILGPSPRAVPKPGFQDSLENIQRGMPRLKFAFELTDDDDNDDMPALEYVDTTAAKTIN